MRQCAIGVTTFGGPEVLSIFIVVYLAFSVPALIAGVAVTHYGLRDTT